MKKSVQISEVKKALKECEAITGVFGVLTMIFIFITMCAIENHVIVGFISTGAACVTVLFYNYYNNYVILLQNKLYDILRKTKK